MVERVRSPMLYSQQRDLMVGALKYGNAFMFKLLSLVFIKVLIHAHRVTEEVF